MQIVPVLDLSKGLVVHAKKGDRENYQPISSRLCSSAKPIEIVNLLFDLHSFKSLYIADLDALQKQGENTEIIESICNQYPEIEIWLDTGTNLIKHYLESLNLNSLRLILSTESIESISSFASIIDTYPTHNFLLSIDYRSSNILGLNILDQPDPIFPADILVLNLDNVGSNQGIAIPPQINQQSLFNSHKLFYGGGIRNNKDLLKLKKIGFSGALISSALHSGEISREDLRNFSQ